jgi:hypothetical protein|tara:strand:+ start:244 stop:672 length:429 start_codon:yes stop_codon:yes gene_type:complete
MSRIISFRGLIADDGIDTIVLHTNNGAVGYRIVKFKLFPNIPNVNQSSLASIFKVEPTAALPTADFQDNRMVASALYTSRESNFNSDLNVIFDNEIFNQDIYVTHVDINGTRSVNYYIELEQMPLDLSENTVATLKDIRNLA